jgi:regulator of sigma E protease
MLSVIINILLFLLVIGLLTFVHELGHFLAAKAVKAKVSEFSLGYGPKILSKKFKDTTYNIRLLPLGGFVKILGDGDPTKDKEDNKDDGNLKNKSKLAQIFVMIAGVTMNILLAIIFYYIFISSSAWKMPISYDFEDFKPVGAQITKERITDLPYEVQEEGLAKETGIMEKGYIISVNNQKIEYFQDLKNILEENKNKEVTLLLCDLENTECKEEKVTLTDSGKLGVAIGYNYEVTLDYSQNKTFAGLAHTINMVKLTGNVFSSLFADAKETGDYSQLSNSVSGPVGIYFIIDYFKTLGLPIFIGLIADLSVSLAILNLLPIPALDGGRIGILLVEVIIRKDLNEKVENFLINIGFIFILLLMLAIILKDILTIDQLQSIFK